MQSLPAFVSDHGRELASAAKSKIGSELAAAQGTRGVPLTETQWVETLATKAVPALLSAWKGQLLAGGFRLRGASVFCHGTPIVRAATWARGCELGDLLVTHFHEDPVYGNSRNALLLQAKLLDWPPAFNPSPQEPQHDLYLQWPAFKYQSPASLGARSVTPKQPHDGAQYLLLKKGMKPKPVLRTTRVGTPMPAARRHLSWELVRMLMGSSGRPFDDELTAVGTTDWSRVVWDLLQHHRSRILRGSTILAKGAPRIGGDPVGAPPAPAIPPDPDVLRVLGNDTPAAPINVGASAPPTQTAGAEVDAGDGGFGVVVIVTARQGRN